MTREPSSNHWKLLRKLDGSTMTVEEFKKRWELNKVQLAKVLGCDAATLYRWSKRGVEPTEHYQRRLALVNRLWSKI